MSSTQRTRSPQAPVHVRADVLGSVLSDQGDQSRPATLQVPPDIPREVK